MRHIKLIVEYDGTKYVGWQLQPNGTSVQEVMEGALAKILGESVRIYSSGRTDAGVHARGMVTCFRTEKGLPLSAFTDGMNTHLPNDIAVLDAVEVTPDFDPRFTASGKHYRYTICTTLRRSPLSRLYAWHLKKVLNIELMREAATFFIGEHDYASFRTAGCASTRTMRRVDSVEITVLDNFIHIDVNGSGFLRNMVRIMVGTLVEVGREKIPPEHVRKCLQDPGTFPGPTAPAHGLCLEKVFYDQTNEDFA